MTDVLEETSTDTHWPVGQKFRITRGEGDHGFPDHTIVTITRHPGGREHRWSKHDGAILVTTLDPSEPQEHSIGVTAWVTPPDDDDGDRPNCVPVTVERCTYSGHPLTDLHVHGGLDAAGVPSYARNLRRHSAHRVVDGNGEPVLFDRSLPQEEAKPEGSQTVNAETLVNGSTPEWPVVLCEAGHPTYARVHYHVTMPSSDRVLWNDSVFTTTESGLRFDSTPGTTAPRREDLPRADIPAVHGDRPNWPVRECTYHHTLAVNPHFHISSGGDEFDPRHVSMLHNDSVYEQDGYYTERGVRYASAAWLSEQQRRPGDPTNQWNWRPGQRYRVTSEWGAHRFPVGTVVTALRHPGWQDRLPEFHATILDVNPPYDDLTQSVGTTAWVQLGRNVEFVDDGVDAVATCEQPSHPAAEHEHWSVPGRDVVCAGTDDWRPSPVSAHLWQREHGRFVKSSQTVNADQQSVSQMLLRQALPTGLTPREVARRVRQRDNIDVDLRRRHATPAEELLAQIEQARTRRDTARRERAEWVVEAITISRRYAPNWCGVYDSTMSDLGLPGRHEDLPTIESLVAKERGHPEPEPTPVTVQGHGIIQVEYRLDSGDIQRFFEDRFDATNILDDPYPEVDDGDCRVFIRVNREAEVEPDTCICNDDEGDYTDLIPEWVTDSGLSWSIYQEECDND